MIYEGVDNFTGHQPPLHSRYDVILLQIKFRNGWMSPLTILTTFSCSRGSLIRCSFGYNWQWEMALRWRFHGERERTTLDEVTQSYQFVFAEWMKTEGSKKTGRWKAVECCSLIRQYQWKLSRDKEDRRARLRRDEVLFFNLFNAFPERNLLHARPASPRFFILRKTTDPRWVSESFKLSDAAKYAVSRHDVWRISGFPILKLAKLRNWFD